MNEQTDDTPRLTLEQINARLGLRIPPELMNKLGFQPIGLYREHDFERLCDRLAIHCLRAGNFIHDKGR